MRTTIASIAILLCVAFSVGGCMVSGTSSGEMKREMLNSFLFKSADLFYPNGVPKDPEKIHPDLGPAQIDEIQKNFSSVLDGVLKQHAEQYELLAKVFESQLARDVHARIRLTNTHQPVARVESNGDISVDVRVAQSIFRTALVAAFSDNSLFGAGFMVLSREFRDRESHSEQVIIRDFLDRKKRVESTPGHTAFGDALGILGVLFGDDELDPDNAQAADWTTMAELARVSMGVERRYYGPIIFMLSHEVGHLVLGHHTVSPTDSSCEVLRDLEFAADIYAVLLLADATKEFAFFPADVFDPFGSRASLGFDDFFTYTYDFAGFDRAMTIERCGHPDPAERLKIVEKFYRLIRERQFESVLSGIHRRTEPATVQPGDVR